MVFSSHQVSERVSGRKESYDSLVVRLHRQGRSADMDKTCCIFQVGQDIQQNPTCINSGDDCNRHGYPEVAARVPYTCAMESSSSTHVDPDVRSFLNICAQANLMSYPTACFYASALSMLSTTVPATRWRYSAKLGVRPTNQAWAFSTQHKRWVAVRLDALILGLALAG
jgi:hypothetical protein